MVRRPPRCTQGRSSAASDVYKRQVIGGRAHNLEQVREVSAQGYTFAEMSLYDPREVESMLAELVRIREQTGTAYIAHYPNEDNPFDIAVLRERFFPRLKRLVDLSRELGISKGTIHFWMDVRWARPDLIAGKIDLLGEMVDFACLLYTSPSPRDRTRSRLPSSA